LHTAATGTRERPTSVGGFVIVGELLVPYTCPSRLTTRQATHVTPFSHQVLSRWRTRVITHCTHYNHLARTNIHHVLKYTHGRTRTHGRDGRAHTTPPQRRRCVYLLTCPGGGGGVGGGSRDGRRVAAGRLVGITSPVAGNRFRRAAFERCVRARSGSIHERYNMLTRAIAGPYPYYYSFEKESYFFLSVLAK